jgi:hypothetical protein
VQLQQSQYGGQDGRGQDRLHVHDASLTSNPAALSRITHRLGALIHVAQTARREIDSRLGASLKYAQRGDPEGRKQHEPPPPWHSGGHEHASEYRGGHQRDDAERQAPLLPMGTDVRRAING